MKKSMKLLIALFLVFALFATACGDDSSTDAGDSGDDTGDDTGDDAAAFDKSTIGAGVDVAMGRANWASGYIQAEIYNQILTQMGYNVASPAELELDPSAGYLAMAEGTMDFWTNSWYPGHLSWHEAELPDGTLVGDYITIADGLFAGAGVQGFLITKSVADEHGITSMQQINDDPELNALFDDDGDGVADIFGCQESFTCDDIFTAQIAFYGWDNITQVIAGYDAMFAEASGLVAAGEPAIIYTWTPSSYVTELIPGDNVMWLTMHESDVIDSSNPTNQDGGEFYNQQPGFSGFNETSCTQPCQLGWKPADIQVTAANDFLEANPVVNALFPLVKPSVIDISILQVEQANGSGSEDELASIAAGWMAQNQDLVDSWIEEAWNTVNG